MKNYKLTILLIVLFLVSLLLETTIINFPFVFLIGITLSVFIKKIPVFIGVFITSFIIDAFRVTNFGLTSFFILGAVAIVLAYEKLSGSDDAVIATVIISVFLFLYTHFLGYSISLVISFFVVSLIGGYIFSLLRRKGKIT